MSAALADVAARAQCTPLQLSLSWLHHHRLTPIIGTRSAAHLMEALNAYAIPLPEELSTGSDEHSVLFPSKKPDATEVFSHHLERYSNVVFG